MSTTTRSTYQEGSVQRAKRVRGSDVWVFRWRETRADGARVHRKRIIGDVDRFRTKSEAKKAAAHLRVEINTSQQRVATMTVEEAWGHFQAHELGDPEIGRSHTTVENYKVLFASHIIPRWGSTH